MRGTGTPKPVEGGADPDTTFPFPTDLAKYLEKNFNITDVEGIVLSKREIIELAKSVEKLALGIHATSINVYVVTYYPTTSRYIPLHTFLNCEFVFILIHIK